MPDWKRKVAVFLVGQTITTFGSFLVQYAIFWHLTLTTKSGLVLALAAIFGFLPQAIVSIFAGVWADRVNRKIMIIVSDSTIALATLVLAFFMLSGTDDLWLIFLVMAIRSVGAGVQMPAISALVPQIVPTDQLMSVNGINSSIQSSLTLLAPVAAAAVYANFSLEAVLFIDVVTAAIGLSLLATISVPTLARAASAEKPSYLTDLKEGISYIFSNQLVRWVMAIFAIVFLLIVAPSNLSPLMLVRNFGSEVWMLTVLELAFGVGMVLGGALMALLANKIDRIAAIIGTSILFGILAIALGFTVNLIVFYVLFFLIGLAVPAFSTSAMTLLQETVEPERQGRVFGFVGIVMAVAMPLGMSILGPLADVVSVEILMIVTGAATVLIAALAVLLPAGKRAIAAAHASTGSNQSKTS
ncbi:MAG: MFS transporter [Aquiluna sp.]